MKRLALLLLFACAAAALAACGGGGATVGGGDPAATVERYLTAKVGRDAETVRALLCSEMESALERETRAFDSVSDAKLDGMSCTADADGATVRCTGRIVATYGTEQTEFQLASYRVVQEDGEYKWCGETQ